MRDELDQISEDIEHEIDSVERHSRKLDKIINSAYLLRVMNEERGEKLDHAISVLRSMQ